MVDILRVLLMSFVFIVGGLGVLKMPLEFLRGYEHIKDSTRAIGRANLLRRIVGYPLVTIGCFILLYAILETITWIVELVR